MFIADLANGWLKSYKLDYKLEQESLNTEIDQALNDYASKNGGAGGNRPDAKLLLQDKDLTQYPILIEYKGYKDKLVKLDNDGRVANKNSKNLPDYKAINSFAVNGAVHYANAILHYTSYTDIIAIGMTGYKDDTGKLQYEICVYYVSKSNFGIGQKVGDYTDLSFLKKNNFDKFIEKVKQLQMTPEEIEKLRERREQEIKASLVKLNNDIYQNEKGLSERDRVYLVAASIIATLGIPGKVAALEKAELKSLTEKENRDGDIILRKIRAFLNQKSLPQEKRELIIRTLENTLTTENINKVENGESQLKRVFTNIYIYIYVFRVGEAHQKENIVRFIDFSVDGYTRTNRKKASVNLRDTDHAKERYAELVDLVHIGKSKLKFYTEKEYYEGNIDPENGADWNQTAPIDTRPTLDDFKKTVSDYLSWEVSSLLKNQNSEDDSLGK